MEILNKKIRKGIGMFKIFIITMLLYSSLFAQAIVWYPDGTVKEWTEDKLLKDVVDKKESNSSIFVTYLLLRI